MSSLLGPHLILAYLGSRVRLRVFGLWNTTENRGFRLFLKLPFFTALAALAATALASALPARTPAEAASSLICVNLANSYLTATKFPY